LIDLLFSPHSTAVARIVAYRSGLATDSSRSPALQPFCATHALPAAQAKAAFRRSPVGRQRDCKTIYQLWYQRETGSPDKKLVLLLNRPHRGHPTIEIPNSILHILTDIAYRRIGFVANSSPRSRYRPAHALTALMNQRQVRTVIARQQILLGLGKPIDRSRDARQPSG